MKPPGSLRWRLVLAMAFVFVLGLGGALGLHPFEEHGASLSRYFAGIAREPYQDLSVLLVFSIVSIGIIWIVSGWSLGGLPAASREAAKVGPNNPHARLSTARLPVEIRPFVDAVNGALERLAEAYAAERLFVADAAHQLRTPVAVLKLRLQREQANPHPAWSKLKEDIEALDRLVRQLLELARKEEEAHTTQPAYGVADLARAGREAVASIIPMAQEMGRNIDLDVPDSLPVRGRSDELRELVRNLIENALVHGAGAVRLVGRAEPLTIGAEYGCFAVLTISDEGPGLPEGLRSAAFGRFWKKVPNSAGSGLGLAIARQVAISHGGSLAFLSGDRSAIQLTIPKVSTSPRGRPTATSRG